MNTMNNSDVRLMVNCRLPADGSKGLQAIDVGHIDQVELGQIV